MTKFWLYLMGASAAISVFGILLAVIGPMFYAVGYKPPTDRAAEEYRKGATP